MSLLPINQKSLLETFISYRLKCKINNESHQFHQEVQNKYKFLREYEFNLQRENLEKMKIDRELDRQKYIEMKQLQQHL